jgi:hypothetical protein
MKRMAQIQQQVDVLIAHIEETETHFGGLSLPRSDEARHNPARAAIDTRLAFMLWVGLSPVLPNGNCPRVARREEPHVALLGVIAGSHDSREIALRLRSRSSV